MSDQLREKLCPFCGNSNHCGAGMIGGCWCGSLEIPMELIELLPEQNKSCICLDCVNAYQRNPPEFTRLHQIIQP